MWDDLGERIGRAVAKRIVTRAHPLALRRPVVSFTFDDIPVSATAGAAILERRGARGSFYVCGEMAGGRSELYPLAGLDTVADLARRGHEIGCHTARHGRLGKVTGAAYLAQVERNAAVLAPVVGGSGALRTFAYPYGRVRIDVKLALQRRFRGCRGIHDGINEGRLDLGRLRAAPLEDASCDEASIDRLLDETARRRGWLVFYSHDVAEAPTRFGVTPQLLDHAVAGALARGCLVATVDAALDAAQVPIMGVP